MDVTTTVGQSFKARSKMAVTSKLIGIDISFIIGIDIGTVI